jgi:hypothetical protein
VEFRIFPLWRKGDDWLGLEIKSEFNQRATTFHNNNIVGLVEINQEEKPRFKR